MSCRSAVRVPPRPVSVTVILLEDDASMTAAHAAALERAGFTVLLPRASDDVLDLVGRQAPPLAVVVDARPRGPRAVLAQHLATLRPRPTLIAVSGWPREQLTYGHVFDAYCMKPCWPDTIVAFVQSAVSSTQ
jgi:DNA-binding response OmpR family regulator